jgi:hypothetical protein
VFDSEHSFHLWKRHLCTSTIWRQLTDWREHVTTWRDLRWLLYSHSDIVFLLIQSNCIELQPWKKILIRVAWLFDHLVHCSHFWVNSRPTRFLSYAHLALNNAVFDMFRFQVIIKHDVASLWFQRLFAGCLFPHLGKWAPLFQPIITYFVLYLISFICVCLHGRNSSLHAC